MRQARSRLHWFHGAQLTLLEISRLTGMSIWTTRRRASRGIPFENPLHQACPAKTKEVNLRLTGDRDRDLKMIITARHRDVIRRHQRAMESQQSA
jgi:hypothetical protein